MNENENPNQPVEEVVEEQPAAPAPVDEGRFKNFQAEMNRKLENTNAQLEAILQSVLKQNQAPAAPAAPSKPLKDLMFDDPEAYTQHVIQQASQQANQVVNERVRLSTATQSVVNELSAKYPEFSQAGSEAAQEALAEYSKLPAHLQNTPEGTRLAMMNVVANRGLTPAQKKSSSRSDDFTVGGGGAPTTRRPADPKKEIDPSTLAFAELIGIDINDPKRLESLKKASGRKNWNRYE